MFGVALVSLILCLLASVGLFLLEDRDVKDLPGVFRLALVVILLENAFILSSHFTSLFTAGS